MTVSDIAPFDEPFVNISAEGGTKSRVGCLGLVVLMRIPVEEQEVVLVDVPSVGAIIKQAYQTLGH